jgi:hypothetical protein
LDPGVAIGEDRIIITENADDFRKLAARVELHPGLVIRPSVKRDDAERLLRRAIAHLIKLNPLRPQDALVNHVLIVSVTGAISIEPLP